MIFEKFNPYHDAKGRFASASGATSFTYAPGRSRAHDNAIAREKERMGGSMAGGTKSEMTENTGFSNAGTKEFADAVGTAKATNPPGAAWRVTAHTQEELEQDYPGAKLHVTPGGSTVAVTASGDIVSVCKNMNSDDRGSDLMKLAVENGGTKLDSFSGNHGFYQKMGFTPISWTPFSDDPEIQPPGWKESGAKKEPVIFYKYTGADTKMISLEDFINTTKPFLDDENGWGYDKAMKARDDAM